jgi:hypothetical protein
MKTLNFIGTVFVVLFALFVGGCGAIVLLGTIFGDGPSSLDGTMVLISTLSIIAGLIILSWIFNDPARSRNDEANGEIEVIEYRGKEIRRKGSNYLVYHLIFNSLEDAEDFLDKDSDSGVSD